jgi:hypothetical protein
LEADVVNDALALYAAGGVDLDEKLLRCGVCTEDPVSGEVVLDTAKFQEHLVDVYFVFLEDRATKWHPWPQVVCTCLLFALHAECPHCLFARALSLKCRAADVKLDDFPSRQSVHDHFRQVGRRSAAGARAEAKKKARADVRDRLLTEFFPHAAPHSRTPPAVTETGKAGTASLKCLAGHSLTKIRFGIGPKICDICCVEFSAKCWRWTCAPCDYDVCKGCMT